MWWLPIALAQPAPVSEDFRGYVDQAQFFIKREWYPDAAEQLELAVATEDGALDPEAWFLLAQVRYQLADLNRARFAADRALVNSRDDQTTRQTRELLTFFDDKFGMVVVRGPQEATATLLDLQLESTLFDPELRVFFTHLQERVRTQPLVLPEPLGLPAGTYTINGQRVVVAASERTELQVELQGTKASTLQTLQLELAAGLSIGLGGGAKHTTPSPSAQLSVSAPLGSVVVGLLVDWIPALSVTHSGTTAFRATGVGGGARVGFEVPNTPPMVIRPSMGWRVGTAPSLEAACAVQGDGAVCGNTDAELYVYSTGLAHTPFVELAVYYQNRRQRSSWGAGLKTIGEVTFAQLPGSFEAISLDGRSFGVEVVKGERGRTLPGIRILGELSFAF